MSLPILCAQCGDTIGAQEASFYAVFARKVDCPGKGKHVIFKDAGKKCFGLLKKIDVSYHGSETTFSNYEYTGQLNQFLLFFALIFSPARVYINDKIIEWSFRQGFHGEGFEEFNNLIKQNM